MSNKTGIYMTIYGNECEFVKGDIVGYDLVDNVLIPLEHIDFTKFVREFKPELD